MTGAPIVGLDMVQSAAESYNVIVVSLLGGPLLENFRRYTVRVFVSERLNEEFDLVMPDMAAQIEFAILNSVETFPFIRFLVAQDIPGITRPNTIAGSIPTSSPPASRRLSTISSSASAKNARPCGRCGKTSMRAMSAMIPKNRSA